MKRRLWTLNHKKHRIKAIVEILEEAGRPLTTAELTERLRERGVFKGTTQELGLYLAFNLKSEYVERLNTRPPSWVLVKHSDL
jgi:hypothetical protein